MNIDHYDYPFMCGGMYYPTEYLHTLGIFMDENQAKKELKRGLEAEQKSASAKEKREKWIRRLKHMEKALEAMFVKTKKLRSEIAQS